MLGNWIGNKLVDAALSLMGVKEGKWTAVGEKEFMLSNGALYSRPPEIDVIPIGVMIPRDEAPATLEKDFRPKYGETYYFIIFSDLLRAMYVQGVVCQDLPRDYRNISMHNCFSTAERAEAHIRELEDLFEYSFG